MCLMDRWLRLVDKFPYIIQGINDHNMCHVPIVLDDSLDESVHFMIAIRRKVTYRLAEVCECMIDGVCPRHVPAEG